MASVELIGTIESDDEIEGIVEEEDSEDEEVKPKKAKKKKNKDKPKGDSSFDAEFQFDEGSNVKTQSWNLDVALRNTKKDMQGSSSLQEKIAKKREERARKKLKEKSGVDEEEEEMKEEEEEDQLENKKAQTKKEESYISDSDTDEEIDKVKQKKEKESFFEQPPPQVLQENFTNMNLSRPLMKAVAELGFIHPTPVQSATIPIALMGKDICACASTGTGKTAAFMLPILERLLFRPLQAPVTRVLVMVPTRELAIQVHSVSRSLAKFTNIQICLAAGGLESKSQEAALRKLPDIIIATPGRLVDHIHNTPSFDLQCVEILVLDEADRMLDENFKDQMEEIIQYSSRGRQTMLFSATMTDEVKELATLSLNQPVRLFVDSNSDVADNLRQEFIRIRPNRESDRLAIVAALCMRTFSDHCLVFLQTKKDAHHMRIVLGLLGLNVGELHGNLTMLQRLEALQQFKEGEVDILVATDLAARGLDIAGVKTVINHSMPTNIKQYIHRVGRTARAGMGGRSVTLVGENERKMLKDVVKRAKIPVKSRVIPHEVIEKYKDRISKLSQDVSDIFKQEKEEKELRISEMEMNKAKNLIIHEKEIMSRPKRTYMAEKPNTETKDGAAARKKKSKNEIKREKKAADKSLSKEEFQAKRDMEFQKRVAKRQGKKHRLHAFAEDKPKQKTKGAKGEPPKKKAKQSQSFDKELTDTSKKALKEFRSTGFGGAGKAKKGNTFKSKKKYKRR